MIHTLGKIGYSWITILHRMPSGLVNQLLACAWLESGLEIQSPEKSREESADILLKIASIRKRRKPQFDF